MTTSPNESGFFTVWILGLCICLFMVGGMSLDLWRAFSDRRQLAAMTDAAVVAAASQIDLPAFQATPSVLRLDPAAARTRAMQYMNKEATAAGIDLMGVNVQVNNTTVQVIATEQLNTTLLRVLLPNKTLEVSTTSAADARVAAA